MATVKKTAQPHTHSWDWHKIINNLDTKTTGLDLRQLTNAHTVTTSMGGDKKMSPEQRIILDRMLDKKTKTVMDAGQKVMQKRIDLLQSRVDNMTVKTFKSQREKQEALESLIKRAFEDICETLKRGDDEIEAYVDRSIQNYVKGKHHKKKKVRQIIKHSIKVPLAIAAIPLAFVFSFAGITAPLGLIFIKNSAASIKKAVDYYKNHHDGVEGLAKRITKNIAILQPKADAIADLTKKATSGDPNAIKSLKGAKAEMKEEELVGYAFDTFLSIHSKTISHTADLVDKYRRKVNKAKHAAIQIGREIEKLEKNVDKTEDRIKEIEENIKDLPKDFQKHGFDPKDSKPIIDRMTRKKNEKKKHVSDMRNEISQMRSSVQSSIDHVAELEDDYDTWTVKIEEFKNVRPKSVAKWKRAIKGLGLVTSLLETASSGGYDGVGALPTHADKVVAAVGYTEQAHDYVVDGAKQLKKTAEGGS